MKDKVCLISLGCPKNLTDSEIIIGKMEQKGYEATDDPLLADIFIINTCGFIKSAREEAIQYILHAVNIKGNTGKKIIVTGCMAQKHGKDILEQIPEVDGVFGVFSYNEFDLLIDKVKKGEKTVNVCSASNSLTYLNGLRKISTLPSYGYLKIAEGCSNRCSYCTIPDIRGPYRSRDIEDILNEAERMAGENIKEIILVAQDTTMYGMDIYGRKMLSDLLDKLSKIDGIQWLRVLYMYPELIDIDLLETFSSNKKILKYMDIPIQHISDNVLKRMGRRTTSGQIISLITNIKRRMPDCILRTSLITGFPGETVEDFNKLSEFALKGYFDRIGVFPYSREEGTPAFRMPDQIFSREKKRRATKIMSIQKKQSKIKNTEKIGNIYKVLIEGISEDGIFYTGRSYGEAPDIDGKIYVLAKDEIKFGSFVDVKILEADAYDMTGEAIDEPSE